MFRLHDYEFRFAETAADLEQIHALNYATFVREIPQHNDTGTGLLIDKFHSKNRYLICEKDTTLVGMISAHDTPPFSIADRLPDPGLLTQPGVKPVEIRLLAVVPSERSSPVMAGLVYCLYRFAIAEGYSHFVISGVAEQQGLYEHLGFEPLGPAVGTGRASFIPMWLPLGKLGDTMGRAMALWERKLARMAATTGSRTNATRRQGTAEMTLQANGHPNHGKHSGNALLEWPAPQTSSSTDDLICLLPGPVALAKRVKAAFREPIVYHRSEEFLPLFDGVQRKLSAMVGSKPVGLFVGSGTLGNDAVAATINADPARSNGLMLVAGEFGGRLLKQATRWGLTPKVLRWEWGQAWQLDEIEAAMMVMPPGGWVWGAHHETSTGVLNDLPALVALATKYNQRVCVDCVSSLGTVPVDLSGVWLATGASGKAIGSYAGIAFVFADPESLTHIDSDKVPTYLDVLAALTCSGPRFTVPSPLIKSLDAALDVFATPESRAARYQQIADLGRWLRRKLEAIGYTLLAPATVANPCIATFAPKAGQSTAEFVQACQAWGYQVAGQSGYLAERRLVQLAVMGTVTRADLEPLVEKLAE